jgi:hydroxymethylglutaryl-CoA reductase
MRMILALASLALASCSGNAPTNNSAIGGDSGAESITAVNDTTAIDAATGADADMAADVNYTFNEDLAGNDTDNRSDNSSSNKSKQAFEPDEPGTPGNDSD